MNFHKIALLAAAAVALGAAGASAQDRGRRFVDRDLNRDGVLSQEEYVSTGGHPGNFRALDVNGDGVLSRGEFVDRSGAVEGAATDPYSREGEIYRDNDARGGVYQSAAGPEFERMDTNRDSLLSRAEWYGDSRVFRRMDTNNDGVVTTSEYVAYDQANNDGRLVKDGRNSDGTWGDYRNGDYRKDGAYGTDPYGTDTYGRDTYGRGAYYGRDELRTTRFRSLDRNRDGYLSRSEWTSDRTAFALLDRNRDGRLSSYEFADTRGLEGRFEQLDRNRDGVLDRREWSGSSTSFRTMDRNGDGRLTASEFLL
jgi:Ca2+-binding EF-hand superfamily protein